MNLSVPQVDWNTAARVGRRLVAPGPQLSAAQAGRVVTELREVACRCLPIVCDVTGLSQQGQVPVLVVDRPTLIEANVQTAAGIWARWASPKESRPHLPVAVAAGARGAAVGALLSVIAASILGQFDPFAARPRLLLNAPSIVRVERQLQVNPSDFRTWVALHEQTHRVQFANAPWLREHLLALVGQLMSAELDGEPFWQHLFALKPAQGSDGITRARSLRVYGALSGGEAARLLDEISAVMSLLEGHADVMMDRAGPKVVPTVARIRARFDQRRGRRGVNALINQLLGMDAKLAQYRDGARFCREVLAKADLTTLNLAFGQRSGLPSLAELQHPQRWLQRMAAA